MRETTTEPTTVRETTTEATTVRETTTTTAAAEKPVPSAPAVDASRALETADGRAIMLTAGVSPKTKGRVIFELADGTKLGEATIDADGTARFTHTFTKPGSYEVRSYVLAEDGTEGERSVPVTVTVAAKDPADNPGEPGTGNGDTSSSGSSTDNGGSSISDSSSSGSSSTNNGEGSSLENNRTASLALGGGLLALLLSALAVVVVNTPMVRDWFEQMGIRF